MKSSISLYRDYQRTYEAKAVPSFLLLHMTKARKVELMLLLYSVNAAGIMMEPEVQLFFDLQTGKPLNSIEIKDQSVVGGSVSPARQITQEQDKAYEKACSALDLARESFLKNHDVSELWNEYMAYLKAFAPLVPEEHKNIYTVLSKRFVNAINALQSSAAPRQSLKNQASADESKGPQTVQKEEKSSPSAKASGKKAEPVPAQVKSETGKDEPETQDHKAEQAEKPADHKSAPASASGQTSGQPSGQRNAGKPDAALPPGQTSDVKPEKEPKREEAPGQSDSQTAKRKEAEARPLQQPEKQEDKPPVQPAKQEDSESKKVPESPETKKRPSEDSPRQEDSEKAMLENPESEKRPPEDSPRQEKTDPNDTPAPEPEKEAKASGQDTNVSWNPSINLSHLPDPEFAVALKLAEKIEILEEEDKGKLKYTYPLFCFEADRQTEFDPFLELQARLKEGTVSFGHFRTFKRNSIFMTCKNGREGRCLFRYCPYYVAVYIKTLQKEDPKRINAERQMYHLLAGMRKYMSRPAPGNTDPLPPENGPAFSAEEKPGETGSRLMIDGTASIRTVSEDTLIVEWIKETEIQAAQIKTSDMTQENGASRKCFMFPDAIPEAIVHAVYEDFYKAKVIEIPEVPAAKERSADRYFTELFCSAETARALKNPDVPCFYGTLISWGDREADNRAEKEILTALKAKGVTRTACITADALRHASDPECLYIIEESIGIEPDLLDFVPNGKRLRIVSADRYQLSRRLPVNDLFGHYILKSRVDIQTLFADTKAALPEDLRKQCSENRLKDFTKWFCDGNCVVNKHKAEYIAWLCRRENRLIFL